MMSAISFLPDSPDILNNFKFSTSECRIQQKSSVWENPAFGIEEDSHIIINPLIFSENMGIYL